MNAMIWVKYLLKSVWSFVHNVLMTGSPGSGKTLLARAMPGILPEMSIEESLEVPRIYSVADQLPAGTPLIKHRPFRSPHHTVSHAGLVGGGNIPKPREISLAHRGVLFFGRVPRIWKPRARYHPLPFPTIDSPPVWRRSSAERARSLIWWLRSEFLLMLPGV
jgi:energy-coupling factor transporter ATP-binding protein EcfA2